MTQERRGYSGGCQCGAVRYRVAGPLENPHICHCRMCQKAAGNYFMPLARTAKIDFSVTRGTISWFQSSDPVRRGFCRACGTPLIFDAIDSDRLNVTLGSLDEPAAVRPVIQCAPDERMPWFDDLSRLEPEEDSSDWYAAIAPTNHQHPDHDTDHWPEERNRS